jgi:hypothetical protein
MLTVVTEEEDFKAGKSVSQQSRHLDTKKIRKLTLALQDPNSSTNAWGNFSPGQRCSELYRHESLGDSGTGETLHLVPTERRRVFP